EKSLSDLTDLGVILLPLSLKKKSTYVEETDPVKRANALLEDLVVELKVVKLDHKINQSLQQELDKSQKEFVHREKLEEIQKELGEDNRKNKEADAYREKLESLDLSGKTKKKILSEINKYEFMSDVSPDLAFVRN